MLASMAKLVVFRSVSTVRSSVGDPACALGQCNHRPRPGNNVGKIQSGCEITSELRPQPRIHPAVTSRSRVAIQGGFGPSVSSSAPPQARLRC